jgi:hypothetical protein
VNESEVWERDVVVVGAGQAEVIGAYFDRYERTFGLRVHRPVEVRAVRAGEDGRLLVDSSEGMYATRALINATAPGTAPSGLATPGRRPSGAAGCTPPGSGTGGVHRAAGDRRGQRGLGDAAPHRDPRVHLVGYGPSASTIGANRAGRAAVNDIRRLLTRGQQPVSAAA